MIRFAADLVTLPPSLDALLYGAVATPVPAGEAGATVLRLACADGAAYLKCGGGRIADDIVDEAVRLRWLHRRIACPSVIQHVVSGDAAWLLSTALPGRTADEWLAADPGSLPRVVNGVAAALRALHAWSATECPFDAGIDVRLAAARRNIDGGHVDTGDFDDVHAGWSAERVWEKALGLRPAVAVPTVTHGDFSLGNILLDAQGVLTGLIDVGRLGRADPYQDLALMSRDLAEYGSAAQDRFFAAYGLQIVDRKRLEFYECLDEFY